MLEAGTERRGASFFHRPGVRGERGGVKEAGERRGSGPFSTHSERLLPDTNQEGSLSIWKPFGNSLLQQACCIG